MPKHIVVHAKPLPTSNKKFKIAVGKPKLSDSIKRALMNGGYEAVVKYIQAIDRSDTETGSLQFDKALAAQAMQAHLVDAGDAFAAGHKLAKISHAITIGLKAIQDENGNALDHKTRKRLALQDMRKPIAEETSTPTDNG